MLDKLAAVENRYEEICARSEQPDFYNDPKKAAAPCGRKMIWSPLWRLTGHTGRQNGIWQMRRS